MKKIYIIGALALAAGMTSCDDFLDKQPMDKIVNTPEYWNIASNVEVETNRLYNYYAGFGNYSDGTYGDFYFNLTNDDQAGWQFGELSGVTFQGNWAYVNVPTASSTWNNPYTRIRGCNYIITGVRQGSMSDSDKAYYEGIARLNRAFQYFQLVKRYGNVVLADEVVSTTDDALLYGPRTDRDEVMDFIVEDLQYAVANIGNGSAKYYWSSDMASAMLVDVALFEGTYCKYRTQAENGKAPDNSRAEKFLNIAANAAQALINSGRYALEAEYGTIYHSTDITGSKEAIFVKPYSQPNASFGHATIAYTNSSTQIAGMTRDAFNSFLFLDGKPLATTTLDKSDKAVMVDGKPMITNLMAVRDGRLKVLLDEGIGFGNLEYTGRYEGAPGLISGTGYTIKKFYDPELTDYQSKTIGQNITQCPIYSYAPILLAYAEAKAELGTLTQSDLDITVNALNKRVGLPAMTLNPEADPANNMNVSSLLWEIRRCRRCELMFDGNRYWDLVRWHQLHLLGTTADSRTVLQGANISNVPVEDYTNTNGEVTVTTTADGYIQVWPAQNRIWNPKYYFFPIPSGQITLNPQLGQNPGW